MTIIYFTFNSDLMLFQWIFRQNRVIVSYALCTEKILGKPLQTYLYILKSRISPSKVNICQRFSIAVGMVISVFETLPNIDFHGGKFLFF